MKLKLKKLSEQVLVITGASSGIGLVTAREAARRGAKLVLAARSEDALRRLTGEINSRGGEAVYVVADVPGPIDMVNVFRRSQDVEPHLEDILAARPKSVWMQSGIRDDRVAERLARAGIKVVQDRCLMVEHRSLARRR